MKIKVKIDTDQSVFGSLLHYQLDVLQYPYINDYMCH